MKVYDAASIRNIAVVGHTGSGKTQLTSAMLFDAGMVNRLGKVDDGNTVTDFDEEEISRKHTLSASIAYAEWNKTKINLIDTPGFANFFSDARAALRVADGVLVAVDAVSGPEVQTEKMWEEAEAQELPRIVVLTRADRERASLDRTLEALHTSFGRAIIPIQLPIGEESSAVAWSPDGALLACGTRTGRTLLFDTATGAPRGGLVPHQRQIVSAAFSADGRILVTADNDCVRVSDVGTLTTLDEIRPGWHIRVARLTADGRRLVLGGRAVNANGTDPARLAVMELAPP